MTFNDYLLACNETCCIEDVEKYFGLSKYTDLLTDCAETGDIYLDG